MPSYKTKCLKLFFYKITKKQEGKFYSHGVKKI